MVVDSALGDAQGDAQIDRMFHALADTTRRDILRRVGVGETSVSRLADRYAMSFAAVQKHVAVLERAGLIAKQRHGREQLVRTDPTHLAAVRAVLDRLEATWLARVEAMTDLLAGPPDSESDSDPKGSVP